MWHCGGRTSPSAGGILTVCGCYSGWTIYLYLSIIGGLLCSLLGPKHQIRGMGSVIPIFTQSRYYKNNSTWRHFEHHEHLVLLRQIRPLVLWRKPEERSYERTPSLPCRYEAHRKAPLSPLLSYTGKRLKFFWHFLTLRYPISTMEVMTTPAPAALSILFLSSTDTD